MENPVIIHGSENSLDRDAYIIIPTALTQKEAKAVCDARKDINANLLVVDNGKVTWSYKGTIDECNNSILATYHLHVQDFANPITDSVERDYGLKMLRTVRGILSYVSRTPLRAEVKKALVSDDLDFKIEVLKQVDLNTITDFEKSPVIETYKFFAFQLGQTLSLLEDNEELFTKNSVAKKYPQLATYLAREEATPEELQKFLTRFIDFIGVNYTKVNNKQLYMTNFHGRKEILDAKKEINLPPVVVFDIDGTLMDESHRSHLRENKQWEEYFSACDLDKPIEHIIDLANEYKSKGYEVWVMSGRGVVCEEKTRKSLADHGVEYDHLKLRSKDVFIPDYVLKPAWIAKYIGIERVEAIYDDQERVLEGFRKKGLNAIDVATIPLTKSTKFGMK